MIKLIQELWFKYNMRKYENKLINSTISREKLKLKNSKYKTKYQEYLTKYTIISKV